MNRFHTWAWLSWLVSAIVVFSTTRNPFYITIALFYIILIIKSEISLQSKQNSITSKVKTPINLLNFAIIIIIFSAIFNALMSHIGDNVIFTIPQRIPIFSGPITWEAIIYGMINGLIIYGILVTFIQLNLALPVRMIIRLIPRAFYSIAVVTSIALTYIPNTVKQFNKIREAQAIRGYQVNKLRDWVPLIMPLLIGGLERALGLSESMVARGFASKEQEANSHKSSLIILFGLILISAGIISFSLTREQTISTSMLILGLAIIIIFIFQKSKKNPHTTYIKEVWHIWDWIILFGSALTTLAFLLPSSVINNSCLHYNPYPKLTFPAFCIWIGIAMTGLLVPGIINFYFLKFKHCNNNL